MPYEQMNKSQYREQVAYNRAKLDGVPAPDSNERGLGIGYAGQQAFQSSSLNQQGITSSIHLLSEQVHILGKAANQLLESFGIPSGLPAGDNYKDQAILSVFEHIAICAKSVAEINVRIESVLSHITG